MTTATPACAETLLVPAGATASSQENATYAASKAIDGNQSTRWSSLFSNPQWITVDLGSTKHVTRVKLFWEAAASLDYDVQLSDSASGPWSVAHTDTNGNGGTDDIGGLGVQGRYVRIYSRSRTTQYGNSLWEVQVYGSDNLNCCKIEPLTLFGASASSQETALLSAAKAIDGDGTTRWSSLFSNPQWLTIDLGAERHLHRAVLNWEAAASADYDLQLGDAAAGPWTTVYSDHNGNGGTDTINSLAATARFARIYSRARTTQWGNSLWEVKLYGDSRATCGPAASVGGWTSTQIADPTCSDAQCCGDSAPVITLTTNPDNHSNTTANVCLVGLAGSDTLFSAASGVTVAAGQGDDTISSGQHTPPGTGTRPVRIFTGPGNDTISGWYDRSEIYAGAGDDTIAAGPGPALIVPGSGRDTASSANGDDTFVLFAACEATDGKRLTAQGGFDTLISPLSAAELAGRGVILEGFENVIIQSDVCKSDCVAKPNCGLLAHCVDRNGQAVCQGGDGAPCGASSECASGLVCAVGVCRPSCDSSSAPGCVPGHCGNGAKDGAESDVDCGGDCPPCSKGGGCAGNSDCGTGLACGVHNGGCINQPRARDVCWPVQCQDGVDPSECGQPDSPCGPNCACVVSCDPTATSPTCPAGEDCRSGLGQLFDSDAAGVCVTTGQCPSNDPDKCGTTTSLCGKQCVNTPDCSSATAANPSDGNGGECPHLCPDGQACCTLDIHCPIGSMCQAQPNGPGICRPRACAFRHLEPPLCGPQALCGECPSCTPACGNRVCGVDPTCGASCGTCGAGTFCTAEGQCAPQTSNDPPALVDNGGGPQPLSDLPDGPTNPAGTLPGQFSVSDQGTAQYNVPIEVPPGRAGMEPGVSLRYSATRSSGEAGIGWKLEGLSQITRCPRSYALDGYSAPVKNDPTDLFCIDGKRLETIAGSAAYGTNGAEYRTLIDSFARIKSLFDDSSEGLQHGLWPNVTKLLRPLQGPDSFKVWTKDGRILTYGATRDSLVMGRNGVRVGWLLNRVEDRAGNSMVIRYQNLRAEVPAQAADKVPNLVQPKAIFYTGHGTTEGSREVRFDYDTRVDGQLSFAQGGVPMIVGYRLKRIGTYVRGAPVKSYQLSYVNETTSLVSKIAECTGETSETCKPPTEFTYEHVSGFTQGPPAVDSDVASGAQLDVNGDGLPDFLVTTVLVDGVPSNDGLTAGFIAADIAVAVGATAFLTPVGGLAVSVVWNIAKGPLFGWLADKPEITFRRDLLTATGDRLHPTAFKANVGGLPCPRGIAYFADYDQDGRDDVIATCDRFTINAFRSLGDGNFAPVSDNPLATLPKPPSVPGRNGSSSVPPLAAPLFYDVNGDSLQDIVSCADYSTLQVRLRIGRGQGFSNSPVVLRGEVLQAPGPLGSDRARIPFCGEPIPTYRIFDVDGDGTPELLSRYSLKQTNMGPTQIGWYALRYSRSGGQGALAFHRVSFPDSGNSGGGEGMQLGDLNGDGLSDVWRAKGDEATVWLNTGSSFLAQSLFRPRPVLGFDPAGRLMRTALIDHDADGRIDVLENWRSPQMSTNDLDARLNVALGIRGPMTSLEATYADDLQIQLPGVISGGDFRLSGDLDGDGNVDLFGDGPHVFYGSGAHNLLLKSVKDGLGKVLNVRYDDPSTYEQTCSGNDTWPEMCLKRMKGLVAGHNEGFIDAAGTERVEKSYSYHYANGRMSLTGHGWIGFDKRSVHESAGDLTRGVTTSFEPVVRYTPGGAIVSGTQPPYFYPFASLPRRVVFDQDAVDPTAYKSELESSYFARRTVMTNNWVVKLSTSQRPFPTLQSVTTNTYARPRTLIGPQLDPEDHGELRTSCVKSSDADTWGNITQESEDCQFDGQPHVERRTALHFVLPNEADWLISNPIVIRESSGDLSRVTELTYDSRGLLATTKRDPIGDWRLTTYVRNSYGNVEQVIESIKPTGSRPAPATRTTTFQYDSEQIFPLLVTNAKGHQTQLRFDARFGQIKTLVDPNGSAYQQAYDGLGALTLSRTPAGTTSYAYAQLSGAASPSPVGDVYPRLRAAVEMQGRDGTFGGSTIEELDHHQRAVRIRTVGFGGVEVQTEQNYDTRHRLIASTVPHTAALTDVPTTNYQYDHQDRPTSLTHVNADGTPGARREHRYASGVGLASAYQHWLNGLTCGTTLPPLLCAVDLEETIDETGKRDVVIKNHRGLVIRSIDGENVDTMQHVSSYAYDGFYRPRRFVDNGGRTLQFQYDDYGRLISSTDPETGTTSSHYNPFDELEDTLDQRGQSRKYFYDLLGRVEAVNDSDGTTQWVYDQGPSALGRVSLTISPPTTLAPGGQRVAYSYEPPSPNGNRGLPETVTQTINGVTYDVGITYDDLARVDTLSYPQIGSAAPVRAKYHYDSASAALAAITEIGSGTPRPIWKVDSKFQGYLTSQESFGNGAVTTFGYDPDRSWLSSLHTTVGSTTIQDLSYSRYDNGQVFERITPTETKEHTYDAVARLATVTAFATGGGVLASQYRYDAHGNIIQRGNVTSSYLSSQPLLLNQVNGNTYQYDTNGAVIDRSGPDIPSGSQHIFYAPFDLPRQINTGTGAALRVTQIDYTADTLRAAVRNPETTRHFVAGVYQRLLSSTTTDTLEERFSILAGDRTVAEIVRSPGAEKTLFFHQDHLGSPDTISDNTGAASHQDFEPFGAPVDEAALSALTREGFTGHQHDDDLDLIDMGGRIYDPLAARFTTADPIMQAPFWSQGLNRYSYAFNDPLNLTDPSGLMIENRTASNGLAVGTDPAVMGWAAAAGYGLASSGGALSVGVAGLAGGFNIGVTLLMNPFGGSAGGSYKMAGPSAAPTSAGASANGTAAVAQSVPLAPLTNGFPNLCSATGACLAEGYRSGGGGSSGSWEEPPPGPSEPGVKATNQITSDALRSLLLLQQLARGAARAAPSLPTFIPKGKTVGVLRSSAGDLPLRSGWPGPAMQMPKGSPGFDIVTRTHVEGHAAAAMRAGGINEATLFINNPAICKSCAKLLPTMLPPGARLTVVTPTGSTTFVGVVAP